MLKQTIQYENFNGDTVTEDFYFNFTMLEMIEQVEIHNVSAKLDKLVNTSDGPGAYLLFKGLILDAYGVKSDDGRNFEKSPALRHSFETTAAISELIIAFLQDADQGIAFIRGVLPQAMLEQATAAVAAKQAEEASAPKVAGIHMVKDPELAPSIPIRAQPLRPIEDVDTTAAYEQGERQPGVPLDMGKGPMTTSEKRMYTEDELGAIQGAPGTVPISPQEEQFTDEQVLAMDPQELNRRGLLMRAYALKTAAPVAPPVTDDI